MIGLSMGINLVGGSATGWSPAALGASLLGWWDAERSDKIALSGSAVTSWTDLVGGYAATQSVGASRPLYSATSFNNRPGLTFDGLDDELTLSSAPFPVGASAGEIWLLLDQLTPGADATSRPLLAYGGGSSATARRVQRISSAGTNRGQYLVGDGAAPVSSTETTVNLSGPVLIRAETSPTQSRLHVNGVAGGLATVVPATGSVRFRMGATDAGTSPSGAFGNMVFNSVIITGALTEPQKTSLETFLNARKA